jgi:hypothetical protein
MAVICGTPYAGHDPGGADRTRADTDLDGIDASLDQRLGGIGGSDIAGHQLQVGIGPLGIDNRIDNPLGVAMGRIDHHHIDTGPDQSLEPLLPIVADPDRRPGPQTAKIVLAGKGVFADLLDVLDGDQTFEQKCRPPPAVFRYGACADAVWPLREWFPAAQ